MSLRSLLTICLLSSSLVPSVGCGGSNAMIVRTFPSTPRAVSELKRGWAEAVVGDYPVMAYEARESTGRLEVVGSQFDTGTFGIGVSKNAGPLKDAVTIALRQVMKDETYINILRNWAIHVGAVDPPDAPASAPDPSEILQLTDDKLHVGVEMDFAPMEFYNELKREAGADVELAHALAKALGVEVEFVNLPFDTLITAVESGQVDVAISSMTITPARSQKIDFVPYLEAGSGILVIMGNPGRIKRPKDLCGRTIALQEATSQIESLAAVNCE